MTLTPFTIQDSEIAQWCMAAGYKVICGPLINVVVAMNRQQEG